LALVSVFELELDPLDDELGGTRSALTVDDTEFCVMLEVPDEDGLAVLFGVMPPVLPA
jgi:hypothetical protein